MKILKYIFSSLIIFGLVLSPVSAEDSPKPLEFEEFDYELLEHISTYATDESITYLLEPYTGTASNSFSANGYSVEGNGLSPNGSHGGSTGHYASFAFDNNDATYQGTYAASPEYSPGPVYANISFDIPATIQGVYFKMPSFSSAVQFSFDVYVNNSSTPSYSSGTLSGGSSGKTLVFPEPISNITAIKYQGSGFSYDWSGIAEFNLIGEFDTEEVLPPSVTLPTPNEPNITINTEQSTYINTISSPASLGAVINYFRYDYFNIYAVHSSALDFSILDEQDLLVKYQIDSTGRYLIPVYDHSEVVIYGPNLTISTSGLQITPSLYSGVSYSFPNSNGIIQRDINRFDYTYVDLEMLNMYPYEDLPFSNSSTNTGKVDYLGQQLSVRSGGTGSRSIMLEFNGQNYSTTFYIVSTDSFKDIEQAKQEQNQTTINNNIISNFNQLDSTLQHGNALTQGSKNDLDIIDSEFNTSYDRYQSIEQGLIDEYNNNLDDIDLDTYKISNNLDLINTANFVRAQFDRLTLNNPIGLTIGFSLCVGLALLLIGKRL